MRFLVFVLMFVWACMTCSSASTRAADADPVSPREALKQAREKLDSLTSYHLSMNDASGATEIDYVPPDRLRITQSSSTALIIGGKTYLKIGENGWTPAGTNTTLGVLMITLEEDQLIACTDVDHIEDRGVSMLGNLPMHVYDIQTPVNGSTLERTVWIGEKDGLPHYVRRGEGPGLVTAEYSRFQENFAIQEPSDAQSAIQH